MRPVSTAASFAVTVQLTDGHIISVRFVSSPDGTERRLVTGPFESREYLTVDENNYTLQSNR